MYDNFAIDAEIDQAIDEAQPRRRGRGSRQSGRSRGGGQDNCQERYDGCVSLGPRSITVCDECRRECINHGRWPFGKCPRPGSKTPPTRFDTADNFNSYDDFVDFDAFEDALIDSLEAEDTDEFFRRLARGIGRVARGIGRGIGRVARVVGPIASLIPLPITQAIGRVANIAGRLMADGADEFEAIDALVDLAEDEDLLDAAAPVIATLATHGVMPQAARLPPQTRRQIVQAATQATQQLAQRQGIQAARAITPIMQRATQMVQQGRLPARSLPQAIQRTASRAAQNSNLTRQLAAGGRMTRRAACPNCGRVH